MATITSNQSGAWSSTSTWVGGSLPVDNDAVSLVGEDASLTWSGLVLPVGLATITASAASPSVTITISKPTITAIAGKI